MLQRRIVIAFIPFVTLLMLAACSSRSELTSSTAKSMLQEYIVAKNDQKYVLDFTFFSDVLPKRQTFAGYQSLGVGTADDLQAVGRLIQAGFVVQTSVQFQYPNVTGSYHIHVEPANSTYRVVQFDLNLSMQEGSPGISGDYHYQAWYVPGFGGFQAANKSDAVQGIASSDGQITLAYPSTIFDSTGVYRLESSGATKQLIGHDPFWKNEEWTLVGSGPSGNINATQSSFSLSPKTQNLLSRKGFGTVVYAGDVVVDSVDDLLLDGETSAHGTFQWHVDFNEMGRALTGKTARPGKGRVQFSKRPDHTWAIQAFDFY